MTKTELPTFERDDFILDHPPECDMIMAGGVSSGVVYPYAVLQIATKYRLRSIGGTSAGAIAAAFAAAAEYGRRNGRPEAFLVLKKYCDELPERLSSLFQPQPQLADVFTTAKGVINNKSLLRIFAGAKVPFAAGSVAGFLTGLTSAMLLDPTWYGGVSGSVLGCVLGGAGATYAWGRSRLIDPLARAVKDLTKGGFGFCTGSTVPELPERPSDADLARLGLTDWMHRALQEIAFGDPDHFRPLTFGNLRGADPDHPDIDLKVVTTNLSMERPHTLPRLNLSAGFKEDEWRRLFPKPVMDYLCQGGGSRSWRLKDAWAFPSEASLPVLVAIRMSLSFPVLFTTVPVYIYDTALPRLMTNLGGIARRRFVKAHFSDGGLSSNFPIHMFDSLLPGRPTFAFSIDDLPVTEEEVSQRVMLPTSARDGFGVHVKPIAGFGKFGGQIFHSAKNWQDALMSEMTGQRERIARIYLTKKEGGLNLDMDAATSRQLMMWGYEAGCKFTDGTFSFDEHRWRRMLVLYSRLRESLDRVDQVWDGGFKAWFDQYARDPGSFRSLTPAERRRIGDALDTLLGSWDELGKAPIVNARDKLPRRAGRLKIVPDY
ncbi:patatin-like phospholipase domain-containing protein [Novosphingobium gossypii]|uniref:hypothetical protein n=1 Tax=Novosphingobium gossypii TaxID=1604774 RepID=UPI003D1B5652